MTPPFALLQVAPIGRATLETWGKPDERLNVYPVPARWEALWPLVLGLARGHGWWHALERLTGLCSADVQCLARGTHTLSDADWLRLTAALEAAQ